MLKLSSVGNSCTVSSVRLQVPAAPQQRPCLSAHPAASKSCHKGHRGSETLRRELRSVLNKYAFWVGKHRTTWGASCKLFSRKGRFIPSGSSTGTQAWQPFSTRRADVPRSRKLKWGGCEAPGSPSWRKAKVAAPAAVWHRGLISFPCPLPLHSWQRELIKIRNHLVMWTNSLQCFRCFQKGSGSTADAMVKSVPSELGTYTTCSERKEQRKNPLAQATMQQCKLLPRLNAKRTQTSPGQKDVTGREQNTAAAPSSAALPSMGTFQSSSAWICTTHPALASCWHRAGSVHQTTRAPKGPILPLLGPGKTHCPPHEAPVCTAWQLQCKLIPHSKQIKKMPHTTQQQAWALLWEESAPERWGRRLWGICISLYLWQTALLACRIPGKAVLLQEDLWGHSPSGSHKAVPPPFTLGFPISDCMKIHWRNNRATRIFRGTRPPPATSPGEPVGKVRASKLYKPGWERQMNTRRQWNPAADSNSCSTFKNAKN